MKLKVLNESGVYLIKNITNGKVYIGSALNLRQRRSNHFSKLRNGNHSSRYLQNAFNKYGEENFIFEPIEYISQDEIWERESHWIKYYKSNDRIYGYNSRIYVTSNKGFKHTVESKKLISKMRKGKSPEKYIITKEGKEVKRKLGKGLSNFRTPKTEEHRTSRVREFWQGRRWDETARKKVSISNKGSNNAQSKLTEEDVIKIKELLFVEKVSMVQILEEYSISRKALYNIKVGKSWSHVVIPEQPFHFEGKNKGSVNSGTKLTENQVKQIKYELTHLNDKDIAEIFKVHISTIRNIRKGRSWKDI